MRFMLAIRDSLSRFYGKYDTLIRLFLKFVAAFLTFLAIRAMLGQTAVVNHPVILLGLAAACSLLPSNAVIIVGAGLILAHFYGISLEAAVVGGGILLIALLLYFSMAPQSAWPLIMTALALGGGIGCVPALIFGLISGPLSAMGVAFGTLVYYLIRNVEQYGGNLQATASEPAEAMLQKTAELIRILISDREIPLMMAALAVALLVVYFIRGLAIKYAWSLAASAGCLVYLAVRLGGLFAIKADISISSLTVELLVSILAVWIAQTMLFSLDYKKTETVRFADDEYYYYVKAVPKQKIRRKKRGRRAKER